MGPGALPLFARAKKILTAGAGSPKRGLVRSAVQVTGSERKRKEDLDRQSDQS